MVLFATTIGVGTLFWNKQRESFPFTLRSVQLKTGKASSIEIEILNENLEVNIVRTTFMANESNIERKWYVVDATDIPLGRLSTVVASILRGKNKPTFTPHVDTGDHVIVLNAGAIKLTGNKASDKLYARHSGHPGGLTQVSAGTIRAQRPERLIEMSIKGMLPHNALGSKQIKKLHVYAGSEHKNQAQQPVELDITNLI